MSLLKRKKPKQIIRKLVNKLLRSYEDQVLRTRVAVRIADNGKLKYPQQLVTVGKTNADYTTIQAAIDAITDAASDKIYTVLVYPGEYDEGITLSDYVNIVAVDPEVTKILQQVKDNNVECHCYLKITIECASSFALYIRNPSSVIVFDGNISASASYGLKMDNGTLTVNGSISSTSNYGFEIVNGTLTVNGSISSTTDFAAKLSGGLLTILNGTIKCTRDHLEGHGVSISGGTLVLQNVKIVCTHADATSIYAGEAQNVRCMGVWANRDDDANITQLITGGFTFDADVE